MPSNTDEFPIPDFEIDHQDDFAHFLVGSRREILFYLNLLATRRSILTAYINDGQHYFLTSVVAVDDASDNFYLDPSPIEESNLAAQNARQITLVTNIDRIKIQMRLQALKSAAHQNQNVLLASIPDNLLRLQRREFFRLEPPLATPVRCKLVAQRPGDENRTFELTLTDISGGGVCLTAKPELAQYFPRDALFQNCRLEIPEESIIQVNLRVRKTIEMSDQNGDHNLRIGCEFVSMPGPRLATIERYITRIERERKARKSGLAD